MKKIIVAVLVVVLAGCMSYETMDPEESQIQHIIDVLKTKDEIYNASMIWFANTFRSAQDVIQLNDKENGLIIAKGSALVRYDGGSIQTHFTMRVDIKDYKLRITVADPYTQYQAYTHPMVEANFPRYKEYMDGVIESYKAAVFQKDDSW